MQDDFSALEALHRSLRSWWVITLLMILGAAGGLAAQRLRAPLFEAQAVISLNIDDARTGYLTDVEEDRAVEVVGDVIDSTGVVDTVLEKAAEQRIQISAESFRSQSQKERMNYRYLLRVKDPDPQRAAVLANLWAEASYASLTEAYQHVIVAEGLTRYEASLVSCLEQSVLILPSQPKCAFSNLAEVQAELEQTSAAIQQERLAGQGLYAGMIFSLSQEALVPSAPVRYQQGLLAAAGGLIGFLFGLLVVQLGWTDRLGRKHD